MMQVWCYRRKQSFGIRGASVVQCLRFLTMHLLVGMPIVVAHACKRPSTCSSGGPATPQLR